MVSVAYDLCLYSFYFFFFLMIRRPPRSTRTDTLFPYTTLFRSEQDAVVGRLHQVVDVLQVDLELSRGVLGGHHASRHFLESAGPGDVVEHGVVGIQSLHAVDLGAEVAPAGCRRDRSEERRVGKECAVRVDLGGRRLIKKKK